MIETESSGERVVVDDATLRSLYPRLRRLAAVVAPAEVGPDDLLQEAVERLLARVGEDGSDIVNVEGYLRRIIVNAASNHRRRLGRWRLRLHRVTPNPGDDTALDAYPSDVSFLELLSPVERAVLYQQHVEGLGLGHIAQQLGMSEAACKQVAARARRRLRTHLEQELDR